MSDRNYVPSDLTPSLRYIAQHLDDDGMHTMGDSIRHAVALIERHGLGLREEGNEDRNKWLIGDDPDVGRLAKDIVQQVTWTIMGEGETTEVAEAYVVELIKRGPER